VLGKYSAHACGAIEVPGSAREILSPCGPIEDMGIRC